MTSHDMEEALGPYRHPNYAMRFQTHLPGAAPPVQHYDSDAGFDLAYAGAHPIHISPGECEDVRCGISVQWPPMMWGFLVGRSSSFRKRGILVNPAIVDGGFRGELFAVCRNIGNRDVTVQPGDRLAQIIPMPLLSAGMGVVEVPQLDPSERGENGFGSTGT